MSNVKTKEQPSPESLVVDWWETLQSNLGDRAELRRARSLMEIAFTPAYNRLRLDLAGSRWNNVNHIALVAGVLAQIQENASESFGKTLATPGKSGQSAKLSSRRFRRLIQYKTAEETLQPMIRVARLLDRKANVAELASLLYGWGFPKRGPALRRELTFTYFNNAPKEK